MGDLEEHARPVAGGLVAAGGPAVHEVQQHLLAVLDDPMVPPPGDVHHGPDAAGVVLAPGLVETLVGGVQSCHLAFRHAICQPGGP